MRTNRAHPVMEYHIKGWSVARAFTIKFSRSVPFGSGMLGTVAIEWKSACKVHFTKKKKKNHHHGDHELSHCFFLLCVHLFAGRCDVCFAFCYSFHFIASVVVCVFAWPGRCHVAFFVNTISRNAHHS